MAMNYNRITPFQGSRKGGWQMINSTLCYLERGDAYLMLHRVKKKSDLNHDKWIGVGG